MKTYKYLNLFLSPSLLILTSLILQGCGIGGQLLKEADSFHGMAKDEVIIVGSIGLSPKLSTDEQDLNSSGTIDILGYGKMHENRCMIQFNSRPVADDYKSLINPELNKTFFFRVPRDMNYMVDSYILTDFSQYGTAKMILPMWFKIDTKATDKAVYIGDITYIRDDFNAITDIKLKDDYKNVERKFRKIFGKKYKLKKSLIKKI